MDDMKEEKRIVIKETDVEIWLDGLPQEAKDESLARLKQLASQVTERKVQILCGAGMSKGSGLPLASDLATMMVGEIIEGDRPHSPYPGHLKSLANKYPIEAIAEAYVQQMDEPRLRGLIAEELGRGTSNWHKGHFTLEALLNEGYIDRVYTTNFDTLIEEVFTVRGFPITDQNIDELHEVFKKKRVPVFHLHGTIDSKCLIAESETYFLDTPLSRIMMADMVTHWFVWIGYKLNDIDLRTIYLSMHEVLSRKGIAKKPYVVHPLELEKENQSSEWRLADKVWSARHATFIPGKAEQFLPALLYQVRRKDLDSLAEEIIAKKGGNKKTQ